MAGIAQKFKLEMRIAYELAISNSCIMGNRHRKASRNRVNLQWWEYSSTGIQNIGDMLSPVIVEYVLNSKGLNLDDPCSDTTNLVAIGSALGNYAQRAVVWGSGCFSSVRNKRLSVSRYDIRAVRGPLTRKTLMEHGHMDCPEIYGDPAILLPDYYMPQKVVNHSFALIEHYCHKVDGNYYRISPLIEGNDWRSFIDQICGCERVVSSSLHGIILSEAYGIPAVWLKSPQSDSYAFKYNDWYLSTGRTPPTPAPTIQDALRVVPKLPDLEGLKRNLIDSFPFDLWK